MELKRTTEMNEKFTKGTKDRCELADKRISKLEDRPAEIIQYDHYI